MKLFHKIFRKRRRCVLPAIKTMQVDVYFQFAKVYDITNFDVVLGQKFSLLINDPGKFRWFSDEDQVLSQTTKGNNNDVEATALGTSVILIMDESLAIIKKLTINVENTIAEPAADLGLTADPAVSK